MTLASVECLSKNLNNDYCEIIDFAIVPMDNFTVNKDIDPFYVQIKPKNPVSEEISQSLAKRNIDLTNAIPRHSAIYEFHKWRKKNRIKKIYPICALHTKNMLKGYFFDYKNHFSYLCRNAVDLMCLYNDIYKLQTGFDFNTYYDLDIYCNQLGIKIPEIKNSLNIAIQQAELYHALIKRLNINIDLENELNQRNEA